MKNHRVDPYVNPVPELPECDCIDHYEGCNPVPQWPKGKKDKATLFDKLARRGKISIPSTNMKVGDRIYMRTDVYSEYMVASIPDKGYFLINLESGSTYHSPKKSEFKGIGPRSIPLEILLGDKVKYLRARTLPHFIDSRLNYYEFKCKVGKSTVIVYVPVK